MNVFNQIIAGVLPLVPKPIVKKVSSRYIAGATLDEAVRVVRRLNSEGAMTTVDVLGEYIKNMDEARENTDYSLKVLESIEKERLEGNLSIKLTSLGLGLDDAMCEANVRRILDHAKAHGNIFVRFDMENVPYTDRTIDLYLKFRKEYNCGVVLQAYLHRTQDDIRRIMADGPSNFRLCKGIYVEEPEHAIKDYEGIRTNYLACLELMLAGGAYVGIATHDSYLVDGSKKLVAKHKREKQTYEFQMLLGVRDELRKSIIREGYRLRVYVPFGADWYGYSIRRLKENPSMAGHIIKAMFTGGR
ncbi:MAG TPA: proline dehydrogenase family protein [Candidatus Kapabacteria bacterium]|nr:proline dehydrogenase family protein [Candidatus Kapabacteria bacterium]